jgi:glutathione S-transferase
VDAVFGLVFRYLDVFDQIADFGMVKDLPKVQAWRAALAKRPSVQRAAHPEYPELLQQFLMQRNSAI